jgi:hypothetical protein
MEIKKLNEEGIYLPYTIFFVSMLLAFFLIQIDVIQSMNTFYNFSKKQNNLERVYSKAIYDLKKGDIPLQSNYIKYYNDTKIEWKFTSTTVDDYSVTLTCSNLGIQKHVVQFKYNKLKKSISNWSD